MRIDKKGKCDKHSHAVVYGYRGKVFEIPRPSIKPAEGGDA